MARIGRAAAREHVELPPSGSAFLIKARKTLREVQERSPELEVQQVETGVPAQFQLDPLGALVPEGHRLAASPEVPVAKLAASRGSCRGGVGAP